MTSNHCCNGLTDLATMVRPTPLVGLTDLAKRVRPTPVVDATIAPSYSFEGAGGLATRPFWPLAAGTG